MSRHKFYWRPRKTEQSTNGLETWDWRWLWFALHKANSEWWTILFVIDFDNGRISFMAYLGYYVFRIIFFEWPTPANSMEKTSSESKPTPT